MSKYNAITLKELESDKTATSVWVMNNTNPRGVLNISMPDGLGGTTILILPVTWIPVDLTTQATKDDLLKSPAFRRLVTMGSISLISESDAMKIMAEPDAKSEAIRVYSIAQQPDDLGPNINTPEVTKLKSENSGNVSGFAMNIVGMELEEDKVLNMIRGQDGVLTSDDYQYIAENSQSVRVKEYCATKAIEE